MEKKKLEISDVIFLLAAFLLAGFPTLLSSSRTVLRQEMLRSEMRQGNPPVAAFPDTPEEKRGEKSSSHSGGETLHCREQLSPRAVPPGEGAAASPQGDVSGSRRCPESFLAEESRE